MLSVIHHGWATNKIFHSRLPKTVFNSIFLLFYLTENHQICILYQKTFIKKRIVLQSCVKNSYLSYAEFRIHAVKDCLCFYKNSANRAFTFISSKIVYFKQHFAYQIQHPQEMKFPLPLDVLHHCQKITFAAGTMDGVTPYLIKRRLQK